MERPLVTKQISESAFKKYGYVLDYKNANPQPINNGTCIKYDLKYNLKTLGLEGDYHAKIYISEKMRFPLKIEILERHPKGIQMFYPVNNTPFIVIVAPPSINIDENKIESFFVPEGVGIILNAGSWHHSLLALADNASYLVIENDVNGNCETTELHNVHLLTEV